MGVLYATLECANSVQLLLRLQQPLTQPDVVVSYDTQLLLQSDCSVTCKICNRLSCWVQAVSKNVCLLILHASLKIEWKWL